MRLLLVSQDFPPQLGGIQTYCFELAKRLHGRCERFLVVAPQAPGAAELDAALPFPVRRVPGGSNAMAAAALPAIAGLVRAERLDTVFHGQWSTAGASLLARGAGARLRVFTAAHGRELLLAPWSRVPAAQRAYDAARRRVLQGVDGLFPVSRYCAELLASAGVDPARVQVISNGTDPTRFHPMDTSALRARLGVAGRRVLSTVARLVPRKGIDTVLQGLPRILAAHPEVVYVVVGGGPDRARLVELARALGVADHVRFTGKVPEDELPLHYNACDLFVMPARSEPPDVEGFGISFLEAGACGKPVVGARAGGVPEAVREGETGLLVPPDDPEALASAVLRLLGDAELMRRLGEGGRARVLREATWDHVAAAIHRALS